MVNWADEFANELKTVGNVKRITEAVKMKKEKEDTKKRADIKKDIAKMLERF